MEETRGCQGRRGCCSGGQVALSLGRDRGAWCFDATVLVLNSLPQLAIEAMSTVHATDYKPGEIEIGIVSTGEEEDPKTAGKWRVMDEAEVEKHLLAYAEKD